MAISKYKLFPSKKFHEYIFDFIIIVLSIWLSISLDKRKQASNDKNQEISSLQSIRADMVDDTTKINALIEWNDLVQRSNTIFSTADTAGMPIDSISYYFFIMFQYNPFSMNISAYEEMKQSGYSALIENKVMLRNIINHYSTFEGQFDNVNSVDMDYIMQQLVPFVNEHFEDYTKEDVNTWRRGLNKIMDDYRFRNLTQSAYVLRIRTGLQYDLYLENLVFIINEIDTELSGLD